MYRFCFVILHYLSYEATRECVDSIINSCGASAHPFQIVVVDNASTNDSFACLQKHFENMPCVHLLQAPENLGYARGNNLGYRYALDTLKSDFVIVLNNDTTITRTDFLDTLLRIYEQQPAGISGTAPAVIGPDIFSLQGFHQSPYRDHLISDRELSRWIRNRSLWTFFLQMDKRLHLSAHFSCFQNYYDKRARMGKPDDTWQTPHTDVVLHGACVIFTPVFIREFPENAFYPETFLYCEEDILAYLCAQKGLTTLYHPDLSILHKDGVSTEAFTGSSLEKELFVSKNILKSLKLFRKLRH